MKKFLIIFAVLVVVGAAGFGVTKLMDTNDKKEDDIFTIVTSFYPTYTATQNLVKDMDGVTVVNLTENQSGCLHDYQLTTSDMRKLEGADVFVMNGGGMEGFLEEVVARYPDLMVIDASEGIELLESGHVHDHDHEEAEVESEEAHNHDHEEAEEAHAHEEGEAESEEVHNHGDNAHVWMDPERYMMQLNNIAHGLAKADEERGDMYISNLDVYVEKVNGIKEQLDALKVSDDKEVIIFHEAFEYLTNYLGLEVVYSLDLDEESGLSAGAIATVIDEVELHNINVLLTETEYKDSIATNISTETGAEVYVLSALTSKGDSLDAYIDGMQENINVLKGILTDSL